MQSKEVKINDEESLDIQDEQTLDNFQTRSTRISRISIYEDESMIIDTCTVNVLNNMHVPLQTQRIAQQLQESSQVFEDNNQQMEGTLLMQGEQSNQANQESIQYPDSTIVYQDETINELTVNETQNILEPKDNISDQEEQQIQQLQDELEQINTCQESNQDQGNPFTAPQTHKVNQELKLILLDSLSRIKKLRNSSLLQKPILKNCDSYESDKDLSYIQTLEEDDIDYELVEAMILRDKVQTFEQFEYLMTRLVTQRSTKLYEMFGDFKGAYYNLIINMRNELLHKIRIKLKQNIGQDKINQIKQEGNGDYRVLLKIKGVKREQPLSNMDLNSLIKIYGFLYDEQSDQLMI